MRIRVKDVLEMLAAGETEQTILTDFPDLEQEDIRACLEYAARQVDHAGQAEDVRARHATTGVLSAERGAGADGRVES